MTLPQAERRLIIISAGTASRRHTDHAQVTKLLDDIDWSMLADTLRSRKLLTVLGPRIVELADGQPMKGFPDAVESALRTGRRHGALLELVTRRVIHMLADAGVRSTPLKGPLLSSTIYGDHGRRLSSDIDLLVAPDQLHQAVEVVRQLDYAAPSDYVAQNGMPLLHFALGHERGELPPIELHWRVHWYEQSFALERLLSPSLDSLAEWRPRLADQLAALLLFYARDGFIDLRLAADLSAWWDVNGENLPCGDLDIVISHYPNLARVMTVALEVAEKVVGIPAARILTYIPELRYRERLAVRLANPNPHSTQAQLYADKGLIDGLLTPPGGMSAFVRRQLLPPRKVREVHAQHSGRQKTRSPLTRVVGVLGRYGLTLTRALRTRETSSTQNSDRLRTQID